MVGVFNNRGVGCPKDSGSPKGGSPRPQHAIEVYAYNLNASKTVYLQKMQELVDGKS